MTEPNATDDNDDVEYAVEFDDGEMVMSDRDELRERLAFASSGGVFAGEWPRTMMESRDGDEPLWVGTFETTYGKHRPVPIDPTTLDTHMAIFGGTGKGKSTLTKNILVQLAMDGSGFCFIDPKSGGDIYELLRMLPDERLDDVVWIDPSAHDRDRVTGLNFLEPRVDADDPDDPKLRQEVEAITDNLKGVLKGGDFWGPRMNRVLNNIVRAMALSETDYTLLDMYYILNDEDRREAFADAVENEGFDVLAEYSRQIAEELEDSDLDALIGRLQTWVENSITREIVSHEESSVSIAEAVREGKIILVKNDIQSDTAQKAIATAITRRIWTAIQRRAQDTRPDERERFYLMVDEADDVLTEEMEVDKILTKARALDLSLGLISQYPSQLGDSIQDAIFANVTTLLAMAVTEQQDARTIMSQFPEYDKTDLMNLDKFRAWTTIEVNNERRGPFVTETFADYPPRQTEEEAEAAIEQSLSQYGVPRKTTGEMLDELNIPSETTADHITEEEKLADVARAIWISREATSGGENNVALDRVKDVHEKLGAYGDYQFAELLEANPDLYERTRRDGDLYVGLTEAGEQLSQKQDSGSAGSGGKLDHRDLLTQSREALASIGIALEIPEQGGDDDLADGVGHVFTTEHRDVVEALQAGRDIDAPLHVEAETSTLQTRPAQTLENLRQAMEAGRQCVFVVPEAEDDSEKWARKVEELLDAPYAATDAEGNRRYYRSSTPLEAPRGVAVRPADGTTALWWEDGDELVLEGQDGREYIRYDSLTELKEDAQAFPAYVSENDGQYVVYKENKEVAWYDTKEDLNDDWTSINEPFIAEERLPHPPRDEDYAVLIVPDDETEPTQWYQQGDRIALSDLHSTSEESQSDAEQEEDSDNDAEDDDDDDDDSDGNVFASTDF